jgi:adenosylcobinamide kinase / adenosylcobinamide-phosphate guanylyltransferase
MRVLVEGSGGVAGWPQPGCRCASCLRMSGNPRARSTILIDDVVRVGVDGAGVVVAGGAGGAGTVWDIEGYRILRVSGGWEVTAPDGGRLLYGGVPEEGAAAYDVAFLDLLGEPAQLGRLRARGLITADTVTVLAFADHRVPSEGELRRRCGFWRVLLAGDGEAVTTARSAEKRIDAGRAPWRVLVLGGARSGKSEQAELRVAGEPDVTYVATGPGREAADPEREAADPEREAADPERAAADPEWAARVAAHRARRPAWWRTVETTDLAGVLAGASGALLIDGIGTWLAAAMDECGAWDGSADAVQRLAARIGALTGAWRQTRARVVAVSDETGLGVVPATRAGRLFRDELGRLNQVLAAESEETELVVAGRVVPLGPG